MMKNLEAILEKLSHLIAELEEILADEAKQLCYSKINPISLQTVSDIKSKLLNSISYYDELRIQEEQIEGIVAPYQDGSVLAFHWHKIREQANQISHTNQRIYALLNMHMKKFKDLKYIVDQACVELTTYDSAGTCKEKKAGSVCNLTI
ncbi:flagella synthesis protein FlgN (plasmid) [Enterobacter asburiae]|uniref:flagella synthesis protein FlgN n=1 Tax=Enterobacter asburiae TaxID=61645 RepID=UPI0029338254|nr:flagellar export chaperone FlgN [Enterobacter asburiae]EMA4739881.1 flagellar export chaperone FlgN [Enterobacter asburiae]